MLKKLRNYGKQIFVKSTKFTGNMFESSVCYFPRKIGKPTVLRNFRSFIKLMPGVIVINVR